MAFPHLHRVERRGELRCGSVPAAGAQGCTAPATWHVAWRLEPKADFSLLCDRHMAQAQQELVYADRHRAEIDCDMPGTGWLLTEPSRCVPINADEAATGQMRSDEGADPG